MSGLIAIVGRPNVGKSALFNRCVGRRIAIVHDQPGVTRDRISAEAEWRGHPFTLVDTGGIGLLRGERADDVITRAAFDQVQMAIDSADAIILVVNVQEGIVPLDREVSDRLRRSGRPVFVAVNKVDTSRAEAGVAEFTALGFQRIFPVSAIHGRGIEALMDAAAAHLPAVIKAGTTAGAAGDDATAQDDETGGEAPADAPADPLPPLPAAMKLAVVGRPNVGKSSIINSLTHSDRVIVSPIPGTTRDAVDVPFTVNTEGVTQEYILIDTAGLRKARRVADSVEFFSAERTRDAIGRADVVVFVIDAVSGITEQDKKIADLIVEARKACVVVINKWDLVAADVRALREEEISRRELKDKRKYEMRQRMSTLGEFGQWVQERLFFLDYAPVVFTSAQTGFHLDRLLEAVRYVAAQLRQRVPTAILNRTLHDAVETRQPVSQRGYRLKFYYATQVSLAPPTFLLFVNRRDLFPPQYTKYLTDSLRAAFGYEGCPIILNPRSRDKTIEPVRKYLPRTGGGAGGKGNSTPRRPKGAPRPVTSRPSARPGASRPGAPGGPRKAAGGPRKGPGGAGQGGKRPPARGGQRHRSA